MKNKSTKEWAYNEACKIIRKEVPEYYFQFDNAKRRAGCCDYRYKRIQLSKYFTEHNSNQQIINTILHEVAHALAGPRAGHGLKWNETFMKLLIKYNQPLDVSRCYNSRKVKMPKGKHVLECENCKIPHYRIRKTWWMKQINSQGYVNGRCRRCGDSKLRYYHAREIK